MVLSGQDFVRVRMLKQFLNDSTPSTLEEERPSWRWKNDGSFIVKSTHRHFINDSHLDDH